MTYSILSNLIASISDLKKQPMKVLSQSKKQPIAILNRNRPVCYCISPEMYERFVEKLDDEMLVEIVNSRAGEPGILVDVETL